MVNVPMVPVERAPAIGNPIMNFTSQWVVYRERMKRTHSQNTLVPLFRIQQLLQRIISLNSTLFPLVHGIVENAVDTHGSPEFPEGSETGNPWELGCYGLDGGVNDVI